MAWHRLAILLTGSTLFLGAALARAGAQPPPEVISLEREVSLRLAHVRDEGTVEDPKRVQLSQAAILEQKSEKAISAGDYKGAEADLLAAKTILDNLGD